MMAAEEALREERMLQDEGLQEEGLQEERRLREAEERRNNHMEILRQISDLKKNRDLTVNRLRRLINRSISEYNFSVVEDQYIALSNLNSKLNVRILDWEELLDLDQTGNPIYPICGQP